MRSIAIERWSVRAICGSAECPVQVRTTTYELGAFGYVHDALEAGGAISPIDAPGAEDAQSWIGRVDWAFAAWVKCDRALLAEARVDLSFAWIDTVAEIRVNGCRVAVTANEFVPVRVPVKAWLREGLNEIEVRIRGPVAAVEALERQLGPRPVNGDWTPFSFLRKCAANFGWDWGPRAASAGVGRATIEAWSGVRLSAIRPLVVACDETEATLVTHIECERSDDREATIDVAFAGERVSCPVDDSGHAAVTIRVAAPDRWWPRGFGKQTLHPLRVALATTAQVIERQIGLRAVRLITDADAAGSRFVIEVNGREVWCRGANWVPRGPLPRRVHHGDLLESLAADANLNMLRVWGGGIYEDDAFYDRCDVLGILVWQDFMFACATYPETAPYPELVEAEARAQVTRLSSHASVALWCGGNEDILAWWSWGWKERLKPGQTWGSGYWLDLLPRVVAELDPTRPYWTESPYSGSMELHPNDPDRGDRHTWDAKLEGYRTIVPRFCSEFGHQSPPTWESICAILPEHERIVGNAELARRQRARGGDAFQYGAMLAERFAPLTSLDDWVYAAQLLQARAYEIAITWMRANAPRCMGGLFWQWNDVWTGHSWSVIDAHGRKKPSYFAVRRASAPLALGIIPEVAAAPARIVLCRAAGEQGTDELADPVRIRLVDADGRCILDDTLSLRDESAWVASVEIPAAFLSPRDPVRALLIADWKALRAVHAFVADREFAFEAPQCSIERSADGRSVVLRADTLLRDVTLAAGLGPREGLLTLLPGELASIGLDDAGADDHGIVMRSANALGHP